MTIPSPCLLVAAVALTVVACGPHAHTTQPSPESAFVWPADLVLADSAESMPLTHVFPEFPPDMQAEGVGAKFVAVYVVDTTGRVDLRSVRFLLDAPRPFERTVCDALRKMRFVPVRRGGELHPALVVEPFGFFIGAGNVGGGDARWERERPDVDALRQMIARKGLPNAEAQLEASPRCG